MFTSPEERNWAWGVIGKRGAALSSDAVTYFGNVTKDSDHRRPAG